MSPEPRRRPDRSRASTADPDATPVGMPGSRAALPRRTVLAVAGGLGLTAAGLPAGLAAGAAPVAGAGSPARPGAAAGPAHPSGRLANLAHLDFLRVRVRPPVQAGHTTIDLAEDPFVGVLWVYAESDGAGGYRRVGGGTYDPATDTWGQGAFDTDDIARAAVVYLRHLRLTGSAASRAAARDLLRGLTYLQTATGPDAGRTVLWMQPDGTLNPSADPVELPDPSDSGPSYWTARTVWALGEGYAAFRDTDPRFAAFLGDRLDLAVATGRRDLGAEVGRYLAVDGRRAPAWLVVDDAGATAEAVLGLAAYVGSATGRRPSAGTAREVLRVLADGVARQRAGDARTWPFGAVLPSARSASLWHAWAGMAPAALARAGAVLRKPDLVAAATSDAVGFTTHLAVTGGPDNGWSPLPTDRSQIAYGADGRVQGLAELAAATGDPAYRRFAGVAASWFFGANRAFRAVYDPATGVVADGIAADGSVNTNAGAESTIHAQLTMLALDADPVAAAHARVATYRGRVASSVLEAEDGDLGGGAGVLPAPDPAPTEYRLSGSAVSLPSGSSVVVPGRVAAGSLLYPAVRRLPGAATLTVRVAGRTVGAVSSAGVAGRDDSPDPGVLLPLAVGAAPVAGPVSVTAGDGSAAELDAVVVQPPLEGLVLSGAGGASAVLRSFDERDRGADVPLPGTGPVTVDEFDAAGAPRGSRTVTPGPGGLRVVVPAGGSVLLTRPA